MKLLFLVSPFAPWLFLFFLFFISPGLSLSLSFSSLPCLYFLSFPFCFCFLFFFFKHHGEGVRHYLALRPFSCSRQLILDRSFRVFIIWSKRIWTFACRYQKPMPYHFRPLLLSFFSPVPCDNWFLCIIGILLLCLSRRLSSW